MGKRTKKSPTSTGCKLGHSNMRPNKPKPLGPWQIHPFKVFDRESPSPHQEPSACEERRELPLPLSVIIDINMIYSICSSRF